MRGRIRNAVGRGLASIFVLFLSPAVFAGTDQDARDFHDLFRSALPIEKRSPEVLARLHMLPDANVLAATDAPSVGGALELVQKSNLKGLVENTLRTQGGSSLDADAILRKKPLTVVIVPGIFGEFIETRGFEDVLMKPSAARDEFKRVVQEAKEKQSPAAFDTRYSPKKIASEEVPLTDVIHVGSIDDREGRTLVRVVLLYTSFMSLESMIDAPTQAAIFNRRLTKYLELTGPQDLALIGYSRGTIVALEMLSQANTVNSWLPSVEGLVALGGVVWGSTLADQFTLAEPPMTKLLQAAKVLRSEVNPDSKSETYQAWWHFGLRYAELSQQLQEKPNAPKTKDLINPQIPTSLDRRSISNLLFLAINHLGLKRFFQDHADNVRRFQNLFDAGLSGLESLQSRSREKWWSTHEVPKNVTYYSVTAAMANPEANSFENSLFNGPLGYSGRSYDDLFLLQNRLDYEGAAKVSLNDSQVSVAQAMFLPNAIASLLPANTGLKTRMLGTVGTHHWGLALRVVNKLKDGRVNPFPRESLLKAIAAKIALDY